MDTSQGEDSAFTEHDVRRESPGSARGNLVAPDQEAEHDMELLGLGVAALGLVQRGQVVEEGPKFPLAQFQRLARETFCLSVSAAAMEVLADHQRHGNGVNGNGVRF